MKSAAFGSIVYRRGVCLALGFFAQAGFFGSAGVDGGDGVFAVLDLLLALFIFAEAGVVFVDGGFLDPGQVELGDARVAFFAVDLLVAVRWAD